MGEADGGFGVGAEFFAGAGFEEGLGDGLVVAGGAECGFEDGVFDEAAGEGEALAEALEVDGAFGGDGVGEEFLPDLGAEFGCGHGEFETVGDAALKGGIEGGGAVGGEQNEAVVAFDVGEEGVDDGVVVAGGVAGTAFGEEGVGFVEEENGAGICCVFEEVFEVSFGLADVF